jgi:hypothetical protein
MMASSSSIAVTWVGTAPKGKQRLREVENKFGMGRDQPQFETAPRAALIYKTLSTLHFELDSGMSFMSFTRDQWRVY